MGSVFIVLDIDVPKVESKELGKITVKLVLKLQKYTRTINQNILNLLKLIEK